jgi:hypothetical protein
MTKRQAPMINLFYASLFLRLDLSLSRDQAVKNPRINPRIFLKDFLWYSWIVARRKITKENIRNIQRSKGSYYVSIPIGIMRFLGWRERQKVVLRRFGKKIIISDWRK